MSSENLPLLWYVLKVRTRAEQRAQRALTNNGFETFLPTYIDVRRYSDRLKKVPTALFPGYLFCRLDPNHPLSIVTTVGVESIVGQGGVPEPIADSEIFVLQRVLQSGNNPVPWPYLKAGDRVRIQFGSLEGVEGTLVKTRGVDRLVLSIHLLKRSISFEIERDWVRPA